jgi:biopolymer transport protein TolR
MASVLGRSSRSRRRGMAEINMVPFIDVMLVLLIIFMVSAPLITTGVIDLPSVGKAQQRPTQVIEIMVEDISKLRIRSDGDEFTAVRVQDLTKKVAQLQNGQSDVPVVISGDKSVKYEAVVKVMDTLQRAGVKRVGLSVKLGD